MWPFLAQALRKVTAPLTPSTPVASLNAILMCRLRQPRVPVPRPIHALTDNGSCCTPIFAKTCAELGAQYRHKKPRTPQTNGTVERFNDQISSKVLDINVYSHCALKQLLRGFNTAYNARHQRVLDSRTPN